jgi:hypothetical protein
MFAVNDFVIITADMKIMYCHKIIIHHFQGHGG